MLAQRNAVSAKAWKRYPSFSEWESKHWR